MFFRPDQIHKFEDWGYFHWPHTYKLPADEERDRLEKERKEKEEAEKEKAET